jgi:hypothetical protein
MKFEDGGRDSQNPEDAEVDDRTSNGHHNKSAEAEYGHHDEEDANEEFVAVQFMWLTHCGGHFLGVRGD